MRNWDKKKLNEDNACKKRWVEKQNRGQISIRKKAWEEESWVDVFVCGGRGIRDDAKVKVLRENEIIGGEARGDWKGSRIK